MRALTLCQPYATLVAAGEKRYETRSWSTPYRGPVAIHAASTFRGVGGRLAWDRLMLSEPFAGTFERLAEEGVVKTIGPARILNIPLGAVLAVAWLASVERAEQVRSELGQKVLHAPFPGSDDDARAFREIAFGNYEPGRYAWRLQNVRHLEEPVPTGGSLGVWTLRDDIARRVEAQAFGREEAYGPC